MWVGLAFNFLIAGFLYMDHDAQQNPNLFFLFCGTEYHIQSLVHARQMLYTTEPHPSPYAIFQNAIIYYI